MKKLIAAAFVALCLFAFVSCGFDDVDFAIYSEEFISASDFGDVYSDDSPESANICIWQEYSFLLSDLPDPGFVKSSPFKTQIAGGTIYTFTASEDTSLFDLKGYVASLEAVGYVNVITYNTPKLYTGTVYKSDIPILEYTYNDGVILLDVFSKHN